MQHRKGSVRLLTYPNSGEGWNSALQVSHESCPLGLKRCQHMHTVTPASLQRWNGDPDLQPQQFGAAAAEWVAAGASMVGGCCRTTPEHITAIAQAIK